MAIKDVFKFSRKTFFNPAAWIDLQNLSSIHKGIWSTVRSLFVQDKEVPVRETFADAKERMNLTEEDIAQREQNFLFYCYLFVFFAVVAFFYALYLIFHSKAFLGFCLGLAVVSMFLSQAFRFSFWAFQIKHRKLGCTFKEWWEGKVTPIEGSDV